MSRYREYRGIRCVFVKVMRREYHDKDIENATSLGHSRRPRTGGEVSSGKKTTPESRRW
jgi:hypothetical protein